MDDEYYYDENLDAAGDRIRPVHKPFKEAQCVWIVGIGWVYNPTGRRFVY